MSRMQKKNRKKKKRNRKVILLFTIVALLGGTFGACGYSILDKIENKEIAKSDEELGIVENNKSDKVINIALFGVDSRDTEGSGGRSDTIMIASLDKEHDKIKLTSLMRDTYIEIPGRGMDKLTHAYAYGGPELAIKTINQNFDMNIRDYATVDFFGLESIIDALGGVEVDVQDYEIKALNKSVKGIDDITNSNTFKITDSGLQTLNGRQAVAYARIRKVGNGDYQRTERQRVVLEQIINKGMNAGITQYPKLLDTMLPYVETSLSKTNILSLGTSTLLSGINDIDQYRIPVDGYVQNQYINGVSYVVPNTLEDNVQLLHEFIYEDTEKTEGTNQP